MSDVASDHHIRLGAANQTSMKRMAIIIQKRINDGVPIPRSPFAQRIAKRITDPDDKQDFLASVTGERGSGKSYVCLYLLCRISEEVALILGGSPRDYFNPDTNVIALEDAQNVAELLANKKKFQCILIDDASVGLSAHDWNSKSSKNFIKIATTMRTRRWCIIVNSPLQKNLDVSLRDFLQVSISIAGSYHKGGFNLCKATTNKIGFMGKTYHRRISIDGGHRIDYWAAFAPPKDIVEAYDKVREESAIRLNQRIADTGSATVKKVRASKTELNTEMELQRHGDAIKKLVAENPNISTRALSAKLCTSSNTTDRLLARLGIDLRKQAPSPRGEK